eukprot:TRINITY_DN11658_c0_g1_i5.p1 TRINITY_DN11658_c0_g1~~TRINITY_DN11658_c0_g1_i5.p1  ORF type:complete len:301 (+),score=33.52 TRINITY_DN11658_c0_g1_i5:751-1653(+)
MLNTYHQANSSFTAEQLRDLSRPVQENIRYFVSKCSAPRETRHLSLGPVSYTHLTLPTHYSVQYNDDHRAFKQKDKHHRQQGGQSEPKKTQSEPKRQKIQGRFFFQAEDGIRDHAQSRGLGDVYKRQKQCWLTLGTVAKMLLTFSLAGWFSDENKALQQAADNFSVALLQAVSPRQLEQYSTNLCVILQSSKSVHDFSKASSLSQTETSTSLCPKIIKVLPQILAQLSLLELLPLFTETAVSGSTVSYTHLRAHETRHDLVCRLLLEKKNDPKFFAFLVRFESSSVPTTLPTAYDVYPFV